MHKKCRLLNGISGHIKFFVIGNFIVDSIYSDFMASIRSSSCGEQFGLFTL